MSEEQGFEETLGALEDRVRKLEGGDVVTADVTIAPPGMEGMFYSTMDLNAPVAKGYSGKSAFEPPKLGEMPVSRNDGSTCVIKIQVFFP